MNDVNDISRNKNRIDHLTINRERDKTAVVSLFLLPLGIGSHVEKIVLCLVKEMQLNLRGCHYVLLSISA